MYTRRGLHGNHDSTPAKQLNSTDDCVVTRVDAAWEGAGPIKAARRMTNVSMND